MSPCPFPTTIFITPRAPPFHLHKNDEKGFREHEEFVYHINLTKVKKGKNDSHVGIVNTSSNETLLHRCFGTYEPVSS